MSHDRRTLAGSVLAVCTALALLASAGAAAARLPERGPAGGGSQPDHRDAGSASRLLVTWASDSHRSDRAAAVAAAGGRLRHDVGLVSVVDLPQMAAAAAVDHALRRHPQVKRVSPDRQVRAATFDPGYPQQWGLDNNGQNVGGSAGTSGIDARVVRAWDTTRGSSRVVVAVVDTGVDIHHPDLSGAIWQNPGEVADGTDSDGNGFVDDLHGWDFAHGDNTVYDDPGADGHGTEVAGIVAARADNGIGIAGVAPNVRVMPVKFLNSDGGGMVSDAIAAIGYAIDNGADVVNASWVGDGDIPELRDALTGSPVLVVAPAGNDGLDLDAADAPTVVPAAFTLPNLVTVTAMDKDGRLVGFANRGRGQVDLAAPGYQVLTVETDQRYAFVSGTSMAAAFVSGAAALAISATPSIAAADLADAIRRASRPHGGLATSTIAGGFLNAADLLPVVALEGIAGDCAQDPPSAGFTDVGAGNVHARSIDCIAARGVTQGRTADTYAPGDRVSRGAMASFLARVLALAEVSPDSAPPDAFRDDDGTTHERSINLLADVGVVSGVTEDTYAPAQAVTRAQMAVMLVRTHRLIVSDPNAPSRDWFDDDEQSRFETEINKLRDLGITTGGAAPNLFAPAQPLRRDQMASFLVRMLDRLVRHGAVPRA